MDEVELESIKTNIEEAFKSYSKTSNKAIIESASRAKIFEAYALAEILDNLSSIEGLIVELANNKDLKLKGSPGKINRNDNAFFKLYKSESDRDNGEVFGEVWTDVEFTTISFRDSGRKNPKFGDYHELDILVTEPDIKHGSRPAYDEVLIGVECKDVAAYSKGLLREILGVRREISFLDRNIKTKFDKWPNSLVNANPPSFILVYATSINVHDYSTPGTLFSIDFQRHVFV